LKNNPERPVTTVTTRRKLQKNCFTCSLMTS